ncbi:hypothetical protein N657DRAFT_412046 [Parathielavia appendiculata]|uniref:Uncharacterized protein n=1 Tax=Parathielavia appendiculata TaxID=2587402 RepID=A0AAN6TZN9_9PEZI|nr:hypothetical protein N657DRAFT_412046 [Parathielavia appendiculata]
MYSCRDILKPAKTDLHQLAQAYAFLGFKSQTCTPTASPIIVIEAPKIWAVPQMIQAVSVTTSPRARWMSGVRLETSSQLKKVLWQHSRDDQGEQGRKVT